MNECFKVDELTANIRTLSSENEDLRMEIEDLKGKVEEARAYAQDKDKSMEKMRVENHNLLCQLKEVQKKLSITVRERDIYRRERDCFREHLNRKKVLSVKDFMEELSRNGAQSVLIGFK